VEKPVSALDELDPETRAVVTQVLGRRSPELLSRLSTATDLVVNEREQVETHLSHEFHSHPLGPDYEPGDEAKRVDTAIGRFLLRFPIEHTP
jgi:hypothetical protein